MTIKARNLKIPLEITTSLHPMGFEYIHFTRIVRLEYKNRNYNLTTLILTDLSDKQLAKTSDESHVDNVAITMDFFKKKSNLDKLKVISVPVAVSNLIKIRTLFEHISMFKLYNEIDFLKKTNIQNNPTINKMITEKENFIVVSKSILESYENYFRNLNQANSHD